MTRRVIRYMAKTQRTIDSWPEPVEEIIKFNLQALQGGYVDGFSSLPDWENSGKLTDKKLKGGKLAGARQLTIKDADSYRVIYIAEYEDAIYILHAFKKKTEGVDRKAMETVESRLKDLKAHLRK